MPDLSLNFSRSLDRLDLHKWSKWLSPSSSTSTSISSLVVTFISAIIFVLVLNAPLWKHYFSFHSINSLSDFSLMLSYFGFLFGIFIFLLSVFNFPLLQKSILCIFALAAAPSMHFALTMGVVFDPSMLQNFVETNLSEALDLVTLSLVLSVTFFAIIPSFFVSRLSISYKPLLKQLLSNIGVGAFGLLLAAASVYSQYAELSSYVRNNNKVLANLILPIAPIRSIYKNLKSTVVEQSIDKQILDKNAAINPPIGSLSNKPLALVVIVGETAREKSFSLKDVGLAGQSETLLNHDNLVYFSNFWSCGTNTAISVPCMFSLYPKSEYKRDMNRQYENVAEMIQRVGYSVEWRDNNSGCKGVCNQLNIQPLSRDESKQYANDNGFYDMALVDKLAQRISSSKQDKVILLHQMGSHGPAYFKRTPEDKKKLKPFCQNKDLGKCSRTEILNAYNNSILYTKDVISEAIDQLKSLDDNYDTALIYLSDHGESTGEKGIYLHGLPYFMAPDEQTHIPALFWASNSFIENRKINLDCLLQKRNAHLSHDNLSHTLLGLLNIDTTYYDKSLDILDGCHS